MAQSPATIAPDANAAPRRLTLKQEATDDRPREKMIEKGPKALSNAELIGILLGSGTAKKNAVEVGKDLLALADGNLHKLGGMELKTLQKVEGIGPARACEIMAALELGRRRREEDQGPAPLMLSSRAVFVYMQPFLEDLPIEEFWILMLNRARRLIKAEKIASGGVHGVFTDTKVIFSKAILQLADTIILVHNHPSGQARPSPEDDELTKSMAAAGRIVGIRVIDHIIFAQKDFYSYADAAKISL